MSTLHERLVKTARGGSQKREALELDTVGLDKLASAVEGMGNSGQGDLDGEVTDALTGALEAVGSAKKG